MLEKILFVDDDQNLLDAVTRQLEDVYNLHTAASGKKGLEILAKAGPFAVVVADMRMPEMDGIQFLVAAREVAPYSVLMMLTGNVDLQTAINAVNDGKVFRFMTKPCQAEELKKSLKAGIQQYHLVIAEQELLSKTLVGSVQLMTELLGMVNPTAFRKGARLRAAMMHIVNVLKWEEGWRFELAAMLSQVGWLSFPPDLQARIQKGTLEKGDEKIIARAPQVARQLLEKIPRMELIARMIESQATSSTDIRNENFKGEERVVALGANALKLCSDYDNLIFSGMLHRSAIETLEKQSHLYEEEMIKALATLKEDKKGSDYQELRIDQLEPNMILVEGVWDQKGNQILPKGTKLTFAILTQLYGLNLRAGSLRQPVKVVM